MHCDKAGPPGYHLPLGHWQARFQGDNQSLLGTQENIASAWIRKAPRPQWDKGRPQGNPVPLEYLCPWRKQVSIVMQAGLHRSQESTAPPWTLGEPSVTGKHSWAPWKQGNHCDMTESHGTKSELVEREASWNSRHRGDSVDSHGSKYPQTPNAASWSIGDPCDKRQSPESKAAL